VATLVPRASQGSAPGYENVVAPNELGRVREALGRLRAVLDVREIADRCVREVCQTIGFDRAVLFLVEGDELVAKAAYFSGDAAWAGEFLALAQEARPKLTHMLLESEVIRRRKPILVADAQNDPRAFKPLIDASLTSAYIAAPIMPGDNVIAMLHVDRYMSGTKLTQDDVELVWTFAEGFGYAFERARLLARLRRHAVDLVRYSHDDMGLVPPPPPPSPGNFQKLTPAEPTANGGNGDGAMTPLTPREREVIDLVSTGATNSEIAGALVISESTVKSHVKHILRKLGASNRAEAVSRHLSMGDS